MLALPMLKAQEVKPENQAQFITKFRFYQLIGGIIIIRGTFNDIPDTLNFILDTGSGAISIDSATAAEFKIPNFPSQMTVNGIAGIKKVNHSLYNTLHLPGLTVDSLNFFVNDYSLLSSVYGLKIDGVIGYSFLKRYIVAINYDSLQISVYSNGTFNYAKGTTMLRPVFTALPILPMPAKDRRSVFTNFYLDTGAGLCFLLSKKFIEDSTFLKKKRKPVGILVQGPGGKRQMQVTVIKKIKVGPFVFRKVPTNILDDEFNALSYPFIGGLVGNDILRRFNVVLNYKARVIAIKPNSHFQDSYDYSYTGMNLYMEGDRIVIDDIVKGSPADKAELKDGDIILAVNNNMTNDISSYKNSMQNVGAVIPIIISRNGEIFAKRIRIGRIY